MNIVKRIIKFQLINWMGSIVNFFILWLLHGIMGCSIIVSGICAIELALLHNFSWHYLFTWSDRVKHTLPDFLKRLLKYNIIVVSTDLIINLGILYTLTKYFGIHYFIANLLGMMAGPFIKFLIDEFGIFRYDKKSKK